MIWDEADKKILEVIKNGPATAPRIAERTGLSLSVVGSRLTALQARGTIHYRIDAGWIHVVDRIKEQQERIAELEFTIQQLRENVRYLRRMLSET